MTKKQRSAFLNNIFTSAEATQDLQDRLVSHTGFRPGAPPDGGAAAPPGPGAGQPGVFQFVVEILLSPSRGDRQLLPIAIDRELPQIQLQFGLMDSDVAIRPTVSGIVDSGASLCTGNLTFFTALCKAFPHIVDSIIIAKADGFAPICLSGIVKEDGGEATTAELPVLYTLRMPYTLRLGGPVQLQVACGQSVSVNFLIGNTFLKRAVATLCYATHTLRCENLSSNRAFPLIYKAPTLSIPDVDRVQGANLARDAEVVKNLDLLSVMFGIRPAKNTVLSSEQGQALKTSF
jgi:hypothetical protein